MQVDSCCLVKLALLQPLVEKNCIQQITEMGFSQLTTGQSSLTSAGGQRVNNVYPAFPEGKKVHCTPYLHSNADLILYTDDTVCTNGIFFGAVYSGIRYEDIFQSKAGSSIYTHGFEMLAFNVFLIVNSMVCLQVRSWEV